MRKIWISLLITAILLCGCTQGAARENRDAASEESTAAHEVYGKIRSANGNEIVLAIGTLPDSGGWGGNRTFGEGGMAADGERPNRTFGENGATGGDSSNRTFGEGGMAAGGEMPDRASGENSAADGEMPDRTFGENSAADSEMPDRVVSGENSAAGGEMPDRVVSDENSAADGTTGENTASGTESSGPQMRMGMRDGASGGMAGGISLLYTGEERTYLIPVTAAVTMGSGENVRELRFTQLAYKNIVKLTLTEDGVITAVQVLS